MKPALKITGILFFLLLGNTDNLHGQPLLQLLKDFKSYTELPRELSYLHLNKSVFQQGELIGYKAYVLDKGSLELSEETANLYLTITDREGTTVKSDLLWVRKGTASGTILLDSLFHPGEYTIKAYTNWMLNFQEPNHFEQSIVLVDSESDFEEEKDNGRTTVHAHVLPEGGHAPVGVESVFGLVFKDDQGYGLQGVTGRVMDQKYAGGHSFHSECTWAGKIHSEPKARNSLSGGVPIQWTIKAYSHPEYRAQRNWHQTLTTEMKYS